MWSQARLRAGEFIADATGKVTQRFQRLWNVELPAAFATKLDVGAKDPAFFGKVEVRGETPSLRIVETDADDTALDYWGLFVDGDTLRVRRNTAMPGDFSTALTPLAIADDGKVTLRPLAVSAPAANGDLVIQATSNTSLTFKLKGTDGVVRSGSLPLV